MKMRVRSWWKVKVLLMKSGSAVDEKWKCCWWKVKAGSWSPLYVWSSNRWSLPRSNCSPSNLSFFLLIVVNWAKPSVNFELDLRMSPLRDVSVNEEVSISLICFTFRIIVVSFCYQFWPLILSKMVGIQFYGEEGDEVILDDQVKSWFYRTKVRSLFMTQTCTDFYGSCLLFQSRYY